MKQEPECVFSPFDSDNECKGQAPAGYVTCTSQDNTLFALIDWNPRALYVWNLKTCDRICAVKGEQHSKIVELTKLLMKNIKYW